MKFIPEMQNKRKRNNQKQTKKIDCVMCCCHPCDNMEIGLTDSSVNIAEEQRSAPKPNCTAKT